NNMFSFSLKKGILVLENEYIKKDQRCANTFSHTIAWFPTRGLARLVIFHPINEPRTQGWILFMVFI
ncbi:hypothetical protein QR510_31010, partial [Escherichia coli]|uniref:hypothetical protein n=1 Tax=Escherichia coli TaxID=562 RepID=UPI002739816F